jgi:hypothetical protein
MNRPRRQRVTVFEILEAVAAICLARWMAGEFSSHYKGPWHTIVFWTTAIVGTLISFLVLLYTVGWLVHRADRRDIETSHDESPTKPG